MPSGIPETFNSGVEPSPPNFLQCCPFGIFFPVQLESAKLTCSFAAQAGPAMIARVATSARHAVFEVIVGRFPFLP